jgi:undecaprenyl-diphosphatase
MSLWEAVLLGFIQGVFMFVPVSSTSHLTLAEHLLRLPPSESAEMILFKLVVHVGTMVSVAVVFRESLGHIVRNTLRGVREWRAGAVSPLGGLYLRLVGLSLVTTFVTGVMGFTLEGVFSEFFATPMLIAGSLTVTGILLWWTDILPARKVGLRQIGLGVAVIVGVAQGLALMPGLSRSGTTIAFALFAGLKRRWAAEYSFFVAIPTILAASGVQTLRVLRDGAPMALDGAAFLVGFVVAALVGIGALKVVLRLLYAARFRYFSFYVWVLAALVLWAGWQGIL